MQRRSTFHLCLGILLFAGAARPVDITSRATSSLKFADWEVYEFAFQNQLVYRLGAESMNFPNYTLVFDFAPSEDCKPTPAVLVVKVGKYRPHLDGKQIPFSYRITGEGGETTEITETVMQKGDPFAFFAFKELTPQGLLATHANARLAFWIPSVAKIGLKRSDNVFFSLNGYDQAWARARTLCNDNR